MASCIEDFETWLSSKLKALNTDEGVFGSYITGILEGEESIDEKTEALEGILTEITENDITVHCHEILDRWKISQMSSSVLSENAPLENVEEKLVKLLETNAPSTTVQRQYTEEDRKLREAILAQYSQTSDQESLSDNNEGLEDGESRLGKNTNASSVAQAEKEKREKAKIESQKKKEKDREDRERQKQQQQEKKEKRKTQKGERRR